MLRARCSEGCGPGAPGIGFLQSASGLLTCVNAVQPLVGVYDGFYLQSQLGGAMALPSGTPMPARPVVRPDIAVPVLDVRSETELVVFRTHLNRQEDSANFRLWEFAGSGHIGEYGRSLTWPPNPTSPGDPVPRASTPHRRSRSPRRRQRRWRRGPRPVWPRRRRPHRAGRSVGCGSRRPGPVRQALGGIRYPHVEVPIARGRRCAELGAARDPTQTFLCVLSGRTLPLSDAEVADLYPTAQAYVGRFGAAANRAVDGGFLLPEDAEALKAAAAQSPPVDP